MRKHDVRKWLHAVLDLLPVILIPVFMIYSHRHTIDSGSIEVPQNQVVDFNQIVPNQYVHDDWTDFDDFQSFLQYDYTSGDILYFKSLPDASQLIDGHRYYQFFVSNGSDYLYVLGETLITFNSSSTINFYYTNYVVDNTIIGYNGYVNIFNLTQMFGSGNEPTIAQFNQLYSADYYDYTLSRKDLIKGVSTITYDDTDIMSQVVYQLYNSVDKYFNMGNVFNMTGVYDWFNANIFNGNAPISIYIVWNIVLYEFVMDLLFLLYGLFMWFIDMVEKLMEKPLKSVK